jgi:hypothetical protein
MQSTTAGTATPTAIFPPVVKLPSELALSLGGSDDAVFVCLAVLVTGTVRVLGEVAAACVVEAGAKSELLYRKNIGLAHKPASASVLG